MPPWLSSARHHQYIMLTNRFFSPISSCKPLYVSCANIYLLCIPCNKKSKLFSQKGRFSFFFTPFPTFSTPFTPLFVAFFAQETFSFRSPPVRAAAKSPVTATAAAAAQVVRLGKGKRSRRRPVGACSIAAATNRQTHSAFGSRRGAYKHHWPPTRRPMTGSIGLLSVYFQYFKVLWRAAGSIVVVK